MEGTYSDIFAWILQKMWVRRNRATRSVWSAWKSWLFVQVENIYDNVFLRNNSLTKCTSWHKKEKCWNALDRMCCFMKDQEWHCWAFTLSSPITTIITHLIKKRIYYKSYSLRYKIHDVKNVILWRMEY